jgi:hypothetical protein
MTSSRFYVTDPADPDVPVVVDPFNGPHGPVRAGDVVAYCNPAWRERGDTDFRIAGVDLRDGLMIVEEIVDLGAGEPQAILTTSRGESWQVSAANLAPCAPPESGLLTDPDLRLALILALSMFLEGCGEAGPGGPFALAPSWLGGHVLAQDADLRNGCALPTRYARDRTAFDDKPPDEVVPLPGGPATDAQIGAWVRANHAGLRQAIFDAHELRDEHELPTTPDREYEGLGDELARLTGTWEGD